MNNIKSKFPHITDGLEKILKAILILFSGCYALLDLSIIFSRILYRYELDGMEGEGLVQVARLLAGQPIFVRPTVEYVPLIYPPVYYYAAALLSKIIGPGFAALRIVSFAAALLCALLLFRMVREKTGSIFSSLLSVGVLASVFILTDQWFDIARTDMLAAGLCLLALYLTRERAGHRQPLADLTAGVFFSLAIFTKQQNLFVFGIVGLYYAVINWRVAFRLGLAFAATTALLAGLLWFNSQGWFFYYLFSVPASHKFDLQIGGVISALTSQFIPVFILLIACFVPLLLDLKQVFKDHIYRYYYLISLALICGSTISYLNKFAARNVMIPSYLALALLIGLASAWSVDKTRQTTVLPLKLLLPVALLVQFSMQLPAFLNTRTIPSSADLQAGDRLVSEIKNIPGNVLALDQNYLLLYAGKPMFYSDMAMSEIAGEGNRYAMPEWPALLEQIQQLIQSADTNALIVDYYDHYRSIIRGCAREKIKYDSKEVFIPVTGYETRPNFIIRCH